ncbi:MAG: hypothetical protein KY466_02685 [Gemmatimonadetes bacterium]|nr:hypothetical protein [Gemmatimonadota bacterium]
MKRYRRGSDLLVLSAAWALVVASCGPAPGDERLEGQDMPPAAAMLSPRQAGETLDSQLERLRVELAAGMAGDPERLLTAEAITDGLMEARRPFDWLAAGYDVEARLRQLQAMADRVVAQLRRGAPLSVVEEDVETMTRSLTELRGYLAAGAGGPAPPSLDSLLGQDPLAAARVGRVAASAAAPSGVETPQAADAPEEAAQQTPPARRPGGPLGRPVPPDSLID